MLFVDSAALPNESYLQWHSAIMSPAIKKDPVITNNISKPGRITYLLLTKFEGRTVSYGPSFFLLDLWPKREARGP